MRLSGLEVVAIMLTVALFLFTISMVINAIVMTFSASARAAEQVTANKAWSASLVITVLFSAWLRLVRRHFTKRRAVT